MKIAGIAIIAVILLTGCNNNELKIVKLEGEAQGTTYHISFTAADTFTYQSEIDSILRKIDTSMSTYLPVSIISGINRNDTAARVDEHFKRVFAKSMEVSQLTDGLFDVTVGPVVNAYGFGFSKKENINDRLIAALKPLVGYTKVHLEGDRLIKDNPGIIVDFNAIAQGYSVDVLARFLEDKGVQNYLVELGGELKAKGKKNNEYWKVGIDKPNENAVEGHELEAVVSLNNKALCTSGNYRKFYLEGGQKFAHIIDPRTCYPAKQNILSATVVAKDAITADAYATVFMVAGLDEAKKFLATHPELGLEVFFVYDEQGEWKTYTSESLAKWIAIVN